MARLRRTFLVLIVLTVLAGAGALGYTKYLAEMEPEVAFPRIKEYGNVALAPKAAHQPRKGMKVVFGTALDAKPTEVNKGLDRAARLLNLYAAAGMPEGDVRVTVVLHGDAAKACLDDKSYAARFDTEHNPNLPLIRELKKAGVEMFVCAQALHQRKYQAEEVAPEVTVAVAATTVLINKQSEGYILVP